MEINKFKIIQNSDERFTIKRMYTYEESTYFGFGQPRIVEGWAPIRVNAYSPRLVHNPVKTFTSLEEAKSYIDKLLLDEKTYPIVTDYP